MTTRWRTDYENYFTPNEQEALRNNPLDESVLKFVAGHQKILDVGSGAGVLSRKLISLGKDVTCVDINTENVKYLKSLGIKAIKADVRKKLPFKDKEFDLVICQEVIEHLENPGVGIKELCRIGSNVIFTLPRMHPDEWHLWMINWEENSGCIVIKMEERK